MPAAAAGLPDSDRLTAFLVSLRGQDFAIDGKQIAACQRLLLDAHAAGADSDAARRLKFRLAPVVAGNPAEQETFYRLFSVLEPAFPGPIQDPVGRAATPAQTDTPPLKRKRTLRTTAAAVSVLAALAITGAGFWYQRAPEPTATAGTASPSGASPPVGKAVNLPPETIEVTETKISPAYPAVKALVALLPLFGFAVWAAVLWRRRMLWLNASLGRSPDLALPLAGDLFQALFAQDAMREGSRNLRHRRRRPSRRLDIPRTVEATARGAGLVSPVWKDDLRHPEYVFLIEQHSTNDHLPRLIDVAVRRLRDEQVAIERYYFRTDPRQLQKDDPERTGISLSEVIGRTEGHRLFVLGTADGFFHPLTGEIESWMSGLEPWRSRTVLSTRPFAQWGRTELRLLEEGFSLATARATGFLAAAGKLAHGSETAAVWLEDVPAMPVPAHQTAAPSRSPDHEAIP